jgi:hypothetical protein
LAALGRQQLAQVGFERENQRREATASSVPACGSPFIRRFAIDVALGREQFVQRRTISSVVGAFASLANSRKLRRPVAARRLEVRLALRRDGEYSKYGRRTVDRSACWRRAELAKPGVSRLR